MRIAITGASGCGKSTLMRKFICRGACLAHEGYCPICEPPLKPRELTRNCGVFQFIMSTDPEHLVKPENREAGVEYVPSNVVELTPDSEPGKPPDVWKSASRYVAERMLTRPGPWLLEGVGLPRALRKWRTKHPGEHAPIERLIVLQQPHRAQLKGQITQGQGMHTVLTPLLPWLRGGVVQWR